MEDLAQPSNYSGISKQYMDFKVPVKTNHIKAKKTQRAQTLMRPALHQKSKVSSSAQHLSSVSYGFFDNNEVQEFVPPLQVSPKSVSRESAKQPISRTIPRSDLISRFSSTAASSRQADHLDEKVEDPIPSPHLAIANSKPALRPVSNSQIMLADLATQGAQTMNSKDIFQKAIYDAPLVDQTKKRKPIKYKAKKHFLKSHPALSSLVIVVAIMLIGGIYISHNLNKISYVLASSRAGFAPTVATYKPSGYNLASISSAAGVIETNYTSNSSSNNNSYSLVEKKSNISSDSLLNNYVFNQVGLNYQTLNVNGKSVYLYNGNSQATWVTGGIWYLIKNNNSLSNHQIYQIVSSM